MPRTRGGASRSASSVRAPGKYTTPCPGSGSFVPSLHLFSPVPVLRCFTGIVHFQGFPQAGLTVQNGGAGLGLAGGPSSEPAAHRDLRRRAELRRHPEPCQPPPGLAFPSRGEGNRGGAGTKRENWAGEGG